MKNFNQRNKIIKPHTRLSDSDTNYYAFINYYQPMHYIAIKITQITFFYVIICAPTCFDPPGSSSGSSECPY